MEFRYRSPENTDPSIPSTDGIANTTQPASTSALPPIPSYQMQNIPLNDSTSLQRIYTVQARKIPLHYPVKKDNNSPGDVTDDLVFAMKVYHPSGFPLSAPTLSSMMPTAPATASPQSGRTSAEPYYAPLPPSVPLDTSIKGTAFVEYPTIDVFLRPHWEELLRTSKISVHPMHQGTEHGNDDTVSHGYRKSIPLEVTDERVKRKNRDDALEEGNPTSSTSHDANAKKPRVEEDVLVEREPHVSHDKAGTTSATAHDQETLAKRKAEEPAENGDMGRVSGLLSLDYGSDSE